MASIKDLLEKKMQQRITARLKIPHYNEDQAFISGLNSFSVYKISAKSSILDGYFYTLDFVSDEAIDIGNIADLEAELSLRDEINPLHSKKIYGKIIRVEEKGSVARKKLYQIQIASPLHYLSLNQRYEIYQEMTVPEIITEILSRYEALLNTKLTVKIDPQSLPKRHTCTQYAQSDLDFIKMLCQEEGFTLLYDATNGAPYTITLCELNEHSPMIADVIEGNINFSKAFAPSAQTQDYYDRKKPSLDYTLQAGANLSPESLKDNNASAQLRTDIKKVRLRDRVEKLNESLYKDLSRYTNIDTQRGLSEGIRITGSSKDLRLSDGYTLNLKDIKGHKNTQVIILNMQVEASFPNALDEYVEVTGDKTTQEQYSVNYTAIPSNIIYKPQAPQNKPRIHGIQTAIVSAGDLKTQEHANEIDVNEFGEIRVLFHFNRNKATSAYIPLSTPFSGEGYGTQFLPRVNSEVVVSYINGNIDKPIITATLHNGENRHPYNLPKEKTKSFIKTQTTPQYEDKEGYNELLFEDKQGDERLSLRAQKDYKLNVLHDSHTHIENDTKTIIDNDNELTIQNDLSQSIGNDKKTNILRNEITTIEKEQILTIKQDQETHVLKDQNTIINENQKSIIEKDLIERIKGTLTKYTEKDAKLKHLQSLYQQVTKDIGVEVTGAYHLNANSLKQNADTVEYEATDGISLKCGGNVLTVDASGIHLKAATVETASGNGGVSAAEVAIPEIEKPLYNKIRVTKLTADITKQDDIKDVITYTAEVEKYNDGAWKATTKLNETQTAQINWLFIKNNDQDDKDILTDNPSNDTLVINGLEMKVTIEDDNIFQYGHAHAFVVDSDDENGHAVSELKRFINVENVRGKNLLTPEELEAKFRVTLNTKKPTQEELDSLKVELITKDANNKEKVEYLKLDDSLVIKHTLAKEHNIKEIDVTVYPEGKPELGAKAITYARPLQKGEMTNARGDFKDDEYIETVNDNMYHFKVDAGYPDGTPVLAVLDVLDEEGAVLSSVQRNTSVQNRLVQYPFQIDKIIEEENLDIDDVHEFKGKLKW